MSHPRVVQVYLRPYSEDEDGFEYDEDTGDYSSLLVGTISQEVLGGHLVFESVGSMPDEDGLLVLDENLTLSELASVDWLAVPQTSPDVARSLADEEGLPQIGVCADWDPTPVGAWLFETPEGLVAVSKAPSGKQAALSLETASEPAAGSPILTISTFYHNDQASFIFSRLGEDVGFVYLSSCYYSSPTVHLVDIPESSEGLAEMIKGFAKARDDEEGASDEAVQRQLSAEVHGLDYGWADDNLVLFGAENLRTSSMTLAVDEEVLRHLRNILPWAASVLIGGPEQTAWLREVESLCLRNYNALPEEVWAGFTREPKSRA